MTDQTDQTDQSGPPASAEHAGQVQAEQAEQTQAEQTQAEQAQAGRADDRRARGLEMMGKVYGWGEVGDSPDEYFGITVDHLFAEIWTRPGLSMRDRRLLLIGALAGQGLDDVLDLQLPAALGNDELSPAELREIVIFLTHYIGWPLGAKLNSQVEKYIAKHERKRSRSSGA